MEEGTDWKFNKCFIIGYAIYLALSFTHCDYFLVQAGIIAMFYHSEGDYSNDLIFLFENVGWWFAR